MKRIAYTVGTVVLVLFSPAIIVLAALTRAVAGDDREPPDEYDGRPPR